MSSLLGGFAGALGGGLIGAARVELLLEATQYQAQLAAAKGETAVATGDMQAATVGASAGMIAAYGAAGLALADFAKNSIQAAVGLQQAQEKLNNSIANSSSVTESAAAGFIAQADSVAQLTGVQNDSIITGQALLVQMGLTADQVTQLTPLVVDLAAKNGIDLNSAFKAVGKAAEGSTGALARYVGPVEKGATASETYANVTDKLGANLGFAAQKAAAEPWIKLKETFHELEQTVGGELLPAIVQVGPELQTLAQDISPLVAEAFKTAAQDAQPLIDTLDQLLTVVHDVSDANAKLSQDSSVATQAQSFFGQALRSGPIQALGKYNSVVLHHLGLLHDDTSATQNAAQAMDQLNTAQRGVSEATKAHTAAIKAQITAEQELAGGAIGLLASLESLRADQAAVNKLKRQGKTDSNEYAAAVQTELEGQLTYVSAIEDLAGTMKDAGASTADVRDKIIELGHGAGLSRAAIQALLDSVSSGAKTAKDNLTGLGDAMDALRGKFREPIKVSMEIQATTSGLTPGTDAFATAVRAAILRTG